MEEESPSRDDILRESGTMVQSDQEDDESISFPIEEDEISGDLYTSNENSHSIDITFTKTPPLLRKNVGSSFRSNSPPSPISPTSSQGSFIHAQNDVSFPLDSPSNVYFSPRFRKDKMKQNSKHPSPIGSFNMIQFSNETEDGDIISSSKLKHDEDPLLHLTQSFQSDSTTSPPSSPIRNKHKGTQGRRVTDFVFDSPPSNTTKGRRSSSNSSSPPESIFTTPGRMHNTPKSRPSPLHSNNENSSPPIPNPRSFHGRRRYSHEEKRMDDEDFDDEYDDLHHFPSSSSSRNTKPSSSSTMERRKESRGFRLNSTPSSFVMASRRKSAPVSSLSPFSEEEDESGFISPTTTPRFSHNSSKIPPPSPSRPPNSSRKLMRQNSLQDTKILLHHSNEILEDEISPPNQEIHLSSAAKKKNKNRKASFLDNHDIDSSFLNSSFDFGNNPSGNVQSPNDDDNEVILALNQQEEEEVEERGRHLPGNQIPLSVNPSPQINMMIPPNILFMRDFEIRSTLGEGEFAIVYHCSYKSTNTECAIKRFNRKFRNRSDRESLLMEAVLLDKLHDGPGSEFIINFHAAWQENGNLFVWMELCSRGSLLGLKDYLISNNTFQSLPDSTLWSIIGDISSGLAHMHAKNIVHLDIKPSNILIAENGRLKIGDLGLAFEGGKDGDGREGDVMYMALELLNSPTRNLSADLFSLGILIYEFGGGVVDLPSEGREWRELRNDLIPNIFPQFRHASLFTLTAQLLSKDPNSRPSASEIMSLCPNLLPPSANSLVRRKSYFFCFYKV